MQLRARERNALSLGLGFQSCQVCVNVFLNSLSTIELGDAAANLGVDLVPVF
jgi:hypothetical protein